MKWASYKQIVSLPCISLSFIIVTPPVNDNGNSDKYLLKNPKVTWNTRTTDLTQTEIRTTGIWSQCSSLVVPKSRKGMLISNTSLFLLDTTICHVQDLMQPYHTGKSHFINCLKKYKNCSHKRHILHVTQLHIVTKLYQGFVILKCTKIIGSST
jgi:hypothetical protein